MLNMMCWWNPINSVAKIELFERGEKGIREIRAVVLS